MPQEGRVEGSKVVKGVPCQMKEFGFGSEGSGLHLNHKDTPEGFL